MNFNFTNEIVAVVGINKNSTRIVEKEKNYIINNNSYKIMNNVCNYYGSSYDGRVKGTKYITGINYKVPIVVEETNNVIFFPIREVENPKCTWISLKWFEHVEEHDGNTYIYFKNGKKIVTNVSKYIIENQVLRSSKLNYLLNERKNAQNY